MSKKFKQKITNYINELVKRGVLVEDEATEDYKIYNVDYEYKMTCNDDEIYRIVYHVDGHLDFSDAIGVDVLIIDDASDLPLLSNIQITLDLPKIEDEDIEEEPVDVDRLKSIENRLDKLEESLLKLAN
jgi:hypothetical protein